MREYILCAAIWFYDGKKYSSQPANVTTGLVLCGHRHHCIFPQIGGLVPERHQLGIYEKEQGFLTNLNRFVDRREGLRIARAAGQVLVESEVRGDRLHSEDLY